MPPWPIGGGLARVKFGQKLDALLLVRVRARDDSDGGLDSGVEADAGRWG
jgi:hypothetical protein